MRAERVDAVLPVVTKLIRLPVEYQLKTGIDKKIILFTAPEVCSCNFSVFAQYLSSLPLAPRGAEGASHSDDSARCLLGRRGMTLRWLIDILRSGLAGSLNINHRGKVIHSGFRWRRAKTSNYTIPSLPAGPTPVLMRRAADLLTAHRFFSFASLVCDLHMHRRCFVCKKNRWLHRGANSEAFTESWFLTTRVAAGALLH